MNATIKKFENSAQLNEQFVAEITEKLADGIVNDGRASLLVSGGNTPKPLFSALTSTDLDWSKVDIALVDDRWVPLTDPASNETMVKEFLLQGNVAKANFVGMKTTHTEAFDAVEEVTSKLSTIKTPFDVVILGMGEDGHTASIFPCCEQLDDGLTTSKPILATQPTTAPHQRMTFSKSALLNSKQLYLHLVGGNKEQALNAVAAETDVRKAPISAFLNQTDVPMTVMLASAK